MSKYKDRVVVDPYVGRAVAPDPYNRAANTDKTTAIQPECLMIPEPTAEKITNELRQGFRLVAVAGGVVTTAWLVRP